MAKAKPDVFGLFGDGDAAIAATDDALVSFEVEQDTYTAAEPRTGGRGATNCELVDCNLMG